MMPVMPDYPPVDTPPEVTAEVKALDGLPELAATPFPFRGHRDFRTFTQGDYDNFSAGVFTKVSDPFQCKWRGGRIKANMAKNKLLELGYVVKFTPPHTEEIGNETDGYNKIYIPLWTLYFVSRFKP